MEKKERESLSRSCEGFKIFKKVEVGYWLVNFLFEVIAK